MALEQTLWLPYLTERMRPLDNFRQKSVDMAAFIEGNQVVRPTEGADPAVLLNATGEQTEADLVETETSFPVHNLRTRATKIEDISEIEISYDRRMSHIDRHSKALNQMGVNFLAYLWSPTATASITRTTGVAKPANLQGATGNRKAMTLDDFAKAVTLINDADFADPSGKNVLMPEQMYTDFMLANKSELLDLSRYGKSVLKDGDLEMLFGVNIIRRGKNNLPRYSNAATPVPKSSFAVGAATDNAVALFWHSEAVSHAMAGYKMYATEDAKAQGWWLSARMRVAGEIIFADQSGVVAVVEDAAV